ncbi:hypothetical protein L3X38_012053 [Prunus dulcis]|uniref:Uncharacterized protein n=1 Tax=Prunus dulcis TaxID=3755 RepID=A0AAD4WL12_PRUDU|nr:hypothetical protein L3X38_012053 [Prunus dulcis]
MQVTVVVTRVLGIRFSNWELRQGHRRGHRVKDITTFSEAADQQGSSEDPRCSTWVLEQLGSVEARTRCGTNLRSALVVAGGLGQLPSVSVLWCDKASVGLENFWEQLWPATLGFGKLGFQGLFDNFVHDFDLAIGLELAGEAKQRRILRLEQNCLNLALSNCRPLFVTMVLGIPKRLTIFCQTKVSMRAAVMVAKASTSTHRHRSNEVQSPLGKRPRTDHGCQWFNWESNTGKSLTLIVLLGEGLGISVRAVVNSTYEWGVCAGLVQELDVDVATYALLQG